jgi:hypothetical protein
VADLGPDWNVRQRLRSHGLRVPSRLAKLAQDLQPRTLRSIFLQFDAPVGAGLRGGGWGGAGERLAGGFFADGLGDDIGVGVVSAEAFDDRL